jgi:prevent-host-death family protein
MPQTFTARQYNQDASSVKRAANEGTVIITERGKPAHVLMTYAEYQRLKGRSEPKATLVAFLESLPLDGLDLARERDTGRDVPL